jgi:hypothetical protein
MSFGGFTPLRLLTSYRCFKRRQCLHLQCQQSTETLLVLFHHKQDGIPILQKVSNYVPADIPLTYHKTAILKKYRCEKLKSVRVQASLFWDVTQRKLVVADFRRTIYRFHLQGPSSRHFGTTYWSHIHGSSSPRIL